MSVATRPLLEFDHSYARELPRLSEPWTAASVQAPAMLILNEELATELGAAVEALREPAGVALLVRVAASHLRVGTFQYAAASRDPALVRKLADYAIARHHPDATEAENPYLEFYRRVIDAQASLVARWMLVGFVHGVMNTDNMTISGETIDYGPCAFMDIFDPATVFSSIDYGGRYAYVNQPGIAQWNLAQLGETLLPLIDGNTDAAGEAAADAGRSVAERNEGYWASDMA